MLKHLAVAALAAALVAPLSATSALAAGRDSITVKDERNDYRADDRSPFSPAAGVDIYRATVERTARGVRVTVRVRDASDVTEVTVYSDINPRHSTLRDQVWEARSGRVYSEKFERFCGKVVRDNNAETIAFNIGPKCITKGRHRFHVGTRVFYESAGNPSNSSVDLVEFRRRIAAR